MFLRCVVCLHPRQIVSADERRRCVLAGESYLPDVVEAALDAAVTHLMRMSGHPNGEPFPLPTPQLPVQLESLISLCDWNRVFSIEVCRCVCVHALLFRLYHPCGCGRWLCSLHLTPLHIVSRDCV
jgi:hypothetical protein